MKTVYPVIFTQTDKEILIEVPDFGILTQGADIVDAINMARDAIGLQAITLEDTDCEIPTPRDIKDVDATTGAFSDDGISYISLVDIDLLEYRRKYDNKAVRRNVTLPNWLNREADREHLNVSKVLQEALMTKLNFQK